MPPKGKEKQPKVVETRDGEEVRCIVVKAEGFIVDKIAEPVLCLQLPEEEEVRRSAILTDCENYEGTWRKEGCGPLVTLQKEGEGITATCDGATIWRTAQQLKVGETTAGELRNVINKDRFTWQPCDIKAESTCDLLVNDQRYLRDGLHAFAFATTWFKLEGFTVTTEAIKSVLAADLTLQIVANNQSTRSTEVTAVSDPKKGKGKVKQSVTEVEKTTVYDTATFSLAPLVVGETQMVVTWEDGAGAKAKQALNGFASLKLTITTLDETGTHRMKLLTPLQESRLLPMCVTIVNVTNVPDSRPVAIHKNEDPMERPLVDTISKQTPQYEHLRRHCHGIHVCCALWPNAPLITSQKVRHEQSPGIHYHRLYLLGEIAAITEGTVTNALALVKYIFHGVFRLQLHDRDTDAAPGFGVAFISLRSLLYDGAKQPTLRLKEQITSYRAAIDAKGDDEGAAKSAVPPGQYMSWGTTVALKITLATPLPKLSYQAYLLNITTAVAACVGAVASLPVSLLTDPDVEHSGSAAAQIRKTPPEAPQFTRLIVRLRYSEASVRPVLHSMMSALLGMDKVGEGDDVVMYTAAKEPPPPEMEEVVDPKKKGKAPPSPAEEPAAPPPTDDGCLQVMCSSGVSGFELIDGVHRVFVFEGMSWSLGVLLEAIHANVRSSDLRDGTVSIVFNPSISFPSRAYHVWPPLVADIPLPKKAKCDDADAGGVGGRIRRLRLECSLQDISNLQRNYVKRRVSDGVFRSIKNLNALCTVKTMQTAMELSLFPSAEDIVALERMYGTTLSTYDVCSADVFHSFTQPLSPDVLAAPTADAPEPERVHTPGSHAELRTLVDQDVVVAGRPAGPMHGRRAEVAATISLPPGTAHCWLYVPQLDDVLLLLLSKMPKPMKTVSLEVEGRLVDVQGTLAVQVYRWRETAKGHLHGTLVNTAFLAKKKADSRRFGYGHYRTIQQQVAKYRKDEQLKRELTMKRDMEENSDEGEGAEDELVLPPVVPPVATNYKYVNANRFKSTRRKQVDSACEAPDTTPLPPPVRKADREGTAFQQLRGGWMVLDVQEVRKGLEVRLKDGKKQGKVIFFAEPLVKFMCRDGEVVEAARDKLLVNAKCSLLDNSHKKKPTPNRVEDLTQSWVPQRDPFERKISGKGFVVTKTNRPFNPVERIDDKAVSVAEDAVRRKAAEKKAWEGKVVVANTTFKVDTNKRTHPIDRHKGLLVDPPTKKALKHHVPEPPPLSIHKPAAVTAATKEVSTVYYSGKSHRWGTLDNKDKKQIKPLLDAEKAGPQW